MLCLRVIFVLIVSCEGCGMDEVGWVLDSLVGLSVFEELTVCGIIWSGGLMD